MTRLEVRKLGSDWKSQEKGNKKRRGRTEKISQRTDKIEWKKEKRVLNDWSTRDRTR